MTGGAWPSISVAMCTYQGARFLPEQLESIAAQTRRPDELVVCDDGSDDGTVATVEAFATRAPFPVRLIVNPERLGAPLNFGQAIARCSNEAITLSDQDDVWRADKLERLAAALAGPLRPGLVFSDGELIDECSEPLGRTCWQAVGLTAAQLKEIGGEWPLPAIVERQRHYAGTVTGATLAFLAELRDVVLPVPAWMAGPQPVLIHDSWITLLAASLRPITPLAECLIGYRRHAGQAAGLPVTDLVGPPGVLDSLRGASGLTGPQVGKANELLWSSAVLDRLRQRRPHQAESAIRLLSGQVTHLRARTALPGRRVRRVPGVLRELASGRYRAYSSGLRSAVRDLSR